MRTSRMWRAGCGLLAAGATSVALVVVPTGVGHAAGTPAGQPSPGAHGLATTTGPLSASNVSSPLDKFYFGLMAKYPSIFGGWTVNGAGQWTIDEVGHNPVFEQAARQAWAQVPSEMGESVSAPTLSFASVANPVAHLEAEQARIERSIPSGVIGVGLDESTNRVRVEFDNASAGMSTPGQPASSAAPASAAGAEASLDAAYGSGTLEFAGGSVPTAASSPTADSAPWKGGDELNSSFDSCSGGPGMHLSTGPDLLETAGHCAYGNPSPTYYNNGTLVGTESAWWVGGSESSPGLDFGVIPTLSSDQAWESNSSLLTFTGYFIPPTGATVCSDGFKGDYTCGTVQATNFTVEETLDDGSAVWVKDTIEITGSIIKGDSGGAGWYSTVYGPLITGTNVSFDSTDWFQQEISAEMTQLSNYYGVTVSPNVG